MNRYCSFGKTFSDAVMIHELSANENSSLALQMDCTDAMKSASGFDNKEVNCLSPRFTTNGQR